MQHRKTLMLVLAALFAALTAVGAFFKIPFALAAISLQFLFTAMAGILLGAGYGALSQGVYVLIGLVGVPIFALGGGLSYVLQPTFGFLLGLIPSAFVIGKLAKRPLTFRGTALAMLAGLAVLYAIGVPYMALILNTFLGKGMGFFGPMRYSELPRFYRDGNAQVDVAMLQVTPMDAHGNFSFALSASHLADMLDLGDHFRAGGGEIVAVLQQRILIERGKAGRHIVYLAVLQDDVEKVLLRLPAFAGGKNGVGSGSIILPLRQPQRIECGQGLTADLRAGEYTEGQRQSQRQQRDQQMLH